MNISSLVDTWLLLRDVESDGERNRILYVLKSRGMAHSNQLREFIMTRNGVELREAYLGPGPWPILRWPGYTSTPDADPAWLYSDILVGILPERHLNNGQPSAHALWISASHRRNCSSVCRRVCAMAPML